MISQSEFLETLFSIEKMERNFRNRLIFVIQHDPEFPTFPTALSKLQSYLSHPDVGFDKIAEIIKMDAGMTARILALVRSAAYAGVPVSSVEEALWRLGLKETRAIVLARKFMIPFSALKVQLDWKKFWFHSLLVARLTYNIYDSFEPVGEKEYLTGLLHDTGKLILAHYFPEKFQAVLQGVQSSNEAMYQVERRFLGTDHAVIATALCHRWNLNQEILNAMQSYLDPENMHPQQLLPVCLSVANRLANQYADNINSRDRLPPPDDITSTPEWQWLKDFKPRRMIHFFLKEECDKAHDITQAMLEETSATAGV